MSTQKIKTLAVSGGVDSVVLLDIFARKFPSDELVVAHFDHGIRDNSSEDAEFVRQLAKTYRVNFYLGEGKLGGSTSEATARTARYDFLNKLARELDGEIYTAHHLDDLVGSVAINLVRGTGWRGLAVLDAAGVRRPFLENYAELGFAEPPAKKDLLRYAGEHNLCFREDQSNSWDEYLRNRLYHQVNNFERKMEIFGLWQQQKVLKTEIDEVIEEILPEKVWQRDWFATMDGEVAMEILRGGLLARSIAATRPQIRDFLQAIRKYSPGKYFNLPNDKLVKMGRDDFVI